jgi:plastocyanin
MAGVAAGVLEERAMRDRRAVMVGAATGLLLALPSCGNGHAETRITDGGPVPAPSGVTPAAVVRQSDELTFAPVTVSIRAGDVAEWRNAGTTPHNVTFDGGAQSSTMQGGESFRLQFPKAGSYAYLCTFHAGMAGTVTVR